MRGIIVAIGLSLALVAGGLALEQASAQQGSAQQGKGKDKGRPPPPPLPRCPDLGLGAHAFVSEIPGQAPLAENEIAISWIIHNSGSAPYVAPNADAQMLTLEYLTPAGAQPLAATSLPSPAPEGGAVALAQGQNWRGYMRATLTPEAQRRRLRMRLNYAGEDRRPPNDCSTANNQLMLAPR
jgi:hypothetical protein